MGKTARKFIKAWRDSRMQMNVENQSEFSEERSKFKINEVK